MKYIAIIKVILRHVSPMEIHIHIVLQHRTVAKQNSRLLARDIQAFQLVYAAKSVGLVTWGKKEKPRKTSCEWLIHENIGSQNKSCG